MGGIPDGVWRQSGGRWRGAHTWKQGQCVETGEAGEGGGPQKPGAGCVSPAGEAACRGVDRAPGMGGEDRICAHPVLMAGGGAGGGPSGCHKGVQVRRDRMPGKDRGLGIETEEVAGGGQTGREERVGRGQRGKELTSGKRSSRRTPRSVQLHPAKPLTGRPGPGRRPPVATLLWFGRGQKCGGT